MSRCLSLGLALLLAAPVAADDPAAAKINKKIDGVPLADAKDAKAVVVVFLSFDCPVSNSYSAALADLAKEYGAKGVRFVGVCASEDDAAEVARLAKEQRLPFPVAGDPKRTAAAAFKATTTPEAFVLDGNSVLRYRGRIDNGWAARLKKNQTVNRFDLKAALDEVLAGKPVQTPVTEAIGCAISHDEARPATGPVTYYRDVLPILQKNCQGCHRPNEVGPFSLMTYKHAVTWGQDIKDYTADRRMPPWKPTAGPAFVGDRRLSDADIRTLAKWVDGKMPAGEPKDAPPPAKFVEGWQLGQPDLILTMPEEMTIGPSGPDLFRVAVLPTGLTEDKYIVGFEVKPGNPRIVHHTLNFWDSEGRGRQMEKDQQAKAKPTDLDRGPGYSAAMGVGFIARPGLGPVSGFGGFGGWAPGQVSRYLPDGTGYLLPKGADVLLQVHYHRNGRVEKDRTQVGLYFAKTPVQKPFRNVTIPGRLLLGIPADSPDYTVKGTIWVEGEFTLYSVMPHMHLLGKSVKVTLTPPGGKAETLVGIDHWDYNWQETYFLKQPIQVKPGTKLEIEAVFDNSSTNPNNPNHPPRRVFFGEQTTQEMLFGFLGTTTPNGGRAKVSLRDPNEKR